MFIFLHRIFDRAHVKVSSFWYSKLFNVCGKKLRVSGRIKISCPQNIKVGDFSSISDGAYLSGKGGLIIGSHVNISNHASINSAGLQYGDTGKDRGHFSKPVHIDDGAWIGAGAIILAGVIVGKNAVIGAGAVVTKDVPPNTVSVGSPARVIKNILE